MHVSLLFANIITVIHSFLIIFVLAGILLSIRYKRFRLIESCILLLTILIWSLYGGCPLTYLENHLRIAAGAEIPLTKEGFIPYYVNSWFGIPISNDQLIIITYITASVFVLISIDWLSGYINIRMPRIRNNKKTKK